MALNASTGVSSASSTNIYIHALPPEINDEHLTQIFGVFGEIESARVIVDLATQKSKGYGFVKYKDPESAKNAIASMDGHKIQDKTIVVKAAFESTPNSNIYVKGLPVETTVTQLKTLFAECGDIAEARILTDSETQISRGSALVRFTDISSAQKAVTTFDGKPFPQKGYPKPISVRFADTEEDKALRKAKSRKNLTVQSRFVPYSTSNPSSPYMMSPQPYSQPYYLSDSSNQFSPPVYRHHAPPQAYPGGGTAPVNPSPLALSSSGSILNTSGGYYPPNHTHAAHPAHSLHPHAVSPPHIISPPPVATSPTFSHQPPATAVAPGPNPLASSSSLYSSTTLMPPGPAQPAGPYSPSKSGNLPLLATPPSPFLNAPNSPYRTRSALHNSTGYPGSNSLLHQSQPIAPPHPLHQSQGITVTNPLRHSGGYFQAPTTPSFTMQAPAPAAPQPTTFVQQASASTLAPPGFAPPAFGAPGSPNPYSPPLQASTSLSSSGGILANSSALTSSNGIVRAPADFVDPNVYIYHLPADTTEAVLYQRFGRFGPIRSVKVVCDPSTGVCKGFGFVRYHTLEAAHAAIAAENGQWMNGKVLAVSLASNKKLGASSEIKPP